MSTIKSSDEHLTLNADGSSKDIKFQANGVEKASIDLSGNLTVSGNLTSLGIDDNGDATAITINSSEQVGIGQTSPSAQLHLKQTSGDQFLKMEGATTNWGWRNQSDGTYGLFDFTNSRWVTLGNSSSAWQFYVNGSEKARFTTDGLTFNGDTAAANALDDYEEGSFTPVFTGSSGSAGSFDTGEWEARYTKIGRLVTINWKTTLTNKGSWSGEVRMTGLPFTPSFTVNGAGSVELLRVNYSGGSVGNVNAYITASQTYWRLRYTHDNDQANMVQVSECANNSAFGGTLSYIVA